MCRVHPGVRMKQCSSRWTNFCQLFCSRLLLKYIEKIQVWLKLGKNNRSSTRRPTYIYDDLVTSVINLTLPLLSILPYLCYQSYLTSVINLTIPLFPTLPYLYYQSYNTPTFSIVNFATKVAVFSTFTTDLVTKFTIVISATMLTKSSFNVHWLLQLDNR